MGSQIATGLLDVLQSIVDASGNSGNAPVLLMLGDFKFSLNTAVFDRVEGAAEFRWACIERTGARDAQQYTGPGEETMLLPGVIYPDARGDATQIIALKQMALQGQPYRLITGNGAIYGYWVITGVRDTQSFFKPDGSFRKQEFTVALKYYGPYPSQS